MLLAEAVNKINNSSSERDKVVTIIFQDDRLKALIKNYVTKHGGSEADAEWVFDEMIVQFLKTVFGKNGAVYTGELNAYLTGIGHNIWYHELKKLGRYSELKEQHLADKIEPGPEPIFLNNEKYKLLEVVLTKLRANCRAVLMHWANGFSMQEIAEKLNYQSEGMARKKKSQCMAELNDFLINHPNIKDQLK